MEFQYRFSEEMEQLGLLPRLDNVRHIVCVQPHPDDFDVAFGATVAYLTASGVRVTYVCVTDDAAGLVTPGLALEERRAIRVREQVEAAALLGVHEVRWLGYADAGEWSVREVRNDLIELFRELRPDAVFTVDPWHPYEAHQDHVRCGLAAAEAAILLDLPYVHPPTERGVSEPVNLSVVGFVIVRNPNAAAEVEQYRELKRQAIAAHASQFSEEFMRMFEDYDALRGKAVGARFGCTFAEGIRLLDTRMLHAFPGVQPIP